MKTYVNGAGRTCIDPRSLSKGQQAFLGSHIMFHNLDVRDMYLDVTDVDVPRLRKEFDWVSEQVDKNARGLPSEWMQSDWIQTGMKDPNYCGTVCCIAGHTMLSKMTEEEVQWAGLDLLSTELTLANLQHDSYSGEASRIAGEMLGLNAVQALSLFDGMNDYHNLCAQFSILMGEDTVL